MANPFQLTVIIEGKHVSHIVSKETIERQAKTAAQAGKSINDACPYPFGTPAAMHFKAVYALHVPIKAEAETA